MYSTALARNHGTRTFYTTTVRVSMWRVDHCASWRTMDYHAVVVCSTVTTYDCLAVAVFNTTKFIHGATS